jgi:hypothetical protein
MVQTKLFVFSLFLFLSLSPTQAQKSVYSFTALTFRIEPAGDKFLPMEPIPFNVTLSNKTERPIIGHSEIKFVWGHIDLIVTDEQGQSVKIPDIQGIRIDRSPPQKEKIAPGATFRSREVFYNLYPIFQQPGSYQIQAIFYNIGKEEKVESSPVTVTLVELSERQRAAFEQLKPLNRGWLFAGQLPADKKFKEFEDFAAEFSDTSYGDYATFILSKRYQARGDLDTAQAGFRKLEASVNSFLRTESQKSLATINEKKAKLERMKTHH